MKENHISPFDRDVARKLSPFCHLLSDFKKIIQLIMEFTEKKITRDDRLLKNRRETKKNNAVIIQNTLLICQ